MDERFQSHERWYDGSRPTQVPARILAVDDHTDTREVLATVLSLEGYLVATSRDGASAISTVMTFRPDIILLDITLPDMSGIEVLQRLRAAGLTRPAIAVTALAFDTDKSAYREAGFSALCRKPVDIDNLLDVLRELIGPIGPVARAR